MRRVLALFLLVFVSACTGPGAPGESSAAATATKAGATNPVAAALSHFHESDDCRTILNYKSPKPANELLVDRLYNTNTGFIDRSQLDGELTGEKWQVPEDARRDIERRTAAKVKVPSSGLPSFVRLIDFETALPDEARDIELRYPQACCYITLWPPGYTADGKRAVVRFSFGPTPHGACATYLLELKDGVWRVVEHDVAYYA